PVTVGATTPSIDATLQPDGQITGTVSGPAASPLAGICVTAVPQASGSLPVVAVTRASGGYTLADLLPGDYKVRFSPGCGATGYATQWYDDAPSHSAATPIPVGAGQTQSAINATLSKSG
ncbi:MAG TPA: carboxypeptidase-like regulatory domain-containing protein, partial [Streptosporangiaceae bacterium]